MSSLVSWRRTSSAGRSRWGGGGGVTVGEGTDDEVLMGCASVTVGESCQVGTGEVDEANGVRSEFKLEHQFRRATSPKNLPDSQHPHSIAPSSHSAGVSVSFNATSYLFPFTSGMSDSHESYEHLAHLRFQSRPMLTD